MIDAESELVLASRPFNEHDGNRMARKRSRSRSDRLNTYPVGDNPKAQARPVYSIRRIQARIYVLTSFEHRLARTTVRNETPLVIQAGKQSGRDYGQPPELFRS